MSADDAGESVSMVDATEPDSGPVTGPCAESVCSADYPCVPLEQGYTCRGQFADWSPNYEPESFTRGDDSVVADARTKLQWQGDLPETYEGCTGTSSDGRMGDSCTQLQAKQYCRALDYAGTGWRLPTKPELESLVDERRGYPSLDVDAFPRTRSVPFWTSSPLATLVGFAWTVEFDEGLSKSSKISAAHAVRCVR